MDLAAIRERILATPLVARLPRGNAIQGRRSRHRQRTATVEVSVGGSVLTFSWHALAGLAKEQYTDAEFADLKRVITESAWTREEHLQQKIKAM